MNPRINHNHQQSKRMIHTMAQLRKYHPEAVKNLPPMLIEKTVNEQIARCLDRMKIYPNTIDTLLNIIHTLYNNSNNIKYHTIPTSSITYQKYVQNIPGAISFLLIMGYEERLQILQLKKFDPVIIQKGINEIHNLQQTSNEYQYEKQWSIFHKEIQNIWKQYQEGVQNNNNDTEQPILPSQLPPPEPTDQYGCSYIQIQLGKVDSNMSIRRMFHSDDTLLDIYHWIAYTLGPIVWNKLLQSNEWFINNRINSLSKSSASLPSYEQSKYITLQSIGLWPSGKLQIRPHIEQQSLLSSKTNPLTRDQHHLELNHRSLGTVTVSSSS